MVFVVLLVIDIATGRVLPWLLLIGLIYIGCLAYARRNGVFRDPSTEIQATDRHT